MFVSKQKLLQPCKEIEKKLKYCSFHFIGLFHNINSCNMSIIFSKQTPSQYITMQQMGLGADLLTVRLTLMDAVDL